jgi:hypothetical protein
MPEEDTHHVPGDGVREGKEIIEIKPIIFGGDPTDPANKMVVSRAQHIELVRYWNGLLRSMRGRPQDGQK